MEGSMKIRRDLNPAEAARNDNAGASVRSFAAPVEAAFVASRNYTVGEMLIVDSTLYRVIRNIGRGQKIVPYLNVIRTDLAEVTKGGQHE